MSKESLGERLRRVRLAANLTQATVAKAAGISASAVSQLESGDSTTFKPENLFAIARRLGKNPEWLATGKGPERGIDELASTVLDLPAAATNEVLEYIAFRWQRANDDVAEETRAQYIAIAEQFKRR